MRNIILGSLALLAISCSNPDTPAGHEGYITKGAIVGAARFYDVQIGPKSPGLGWLLRVLNVDMQWQTFDEDFDVMSADNLNLKFHAHVVMRPRPGTVKTIVEQYGGADYYKRVLQQPFRNDVYEAVAGYKALDAKDQRDAIAEAAASKFQSYVKDKPFEIQAVVIGTINLPPQVAEAQEKKIQKETELAQRDFEIRITQKDATRKIEEAKGLAEAQKIINATLTPLYLQHEAIQAQSAMANAPNHTTVYIPTGSNGIPLIKTAD